jgi:peptidyl-prolyl cis-trans isomerase D
MPRHVDEKRRRRPRARETRARLASHAGELLSVNKLNSILGAAAVIAIAFVFILGYNPMSGSGKARGDEPRCAAEVHGTCIPTPTFWAAYRMLARNYDANRLKAMKLKHQTAEGLIESQLLNDDAKRLGISVSEDELSQEITAGRAHVSLPADKIWSFGQPLQLGPELVRYFNFKSRQGKKFDLKTYEREIRMVTRLSPSDFRDYQRSELIAARMRDLVRSRVRVGENEAFDDFSREKSTATVDFVRLDRRFYAAMAIDSSPKAVEAWAAKNEEEVKKIWGSRKSQLLPECRVTRHILTRFDDTADEATKEAAKKRIERALERIRGGEDFAKVAKGMSDDPGSAVEGGDLGCVPKGRMVKPFEDAMNALEVGKMSEIVKSEFGYHLIKVEKIAKDEELEKIGLARTARDLYLSHESERMAAEGSKQILAAVAGGKPLKDAIAAHVDEVVLKKDAGGKADEGGDKDKKKKKKGDKGEGGDKDEKGEKAEKPSEDDRPPVTAANHPQRPTLETSMPFNVGGEPFSGTKTKSEVSKIAFELKKPGDVPKDVVPIETGYVVMQLREKTPASKEDWAKNRDHYMTKLRMTKQADAMVAYMKRLRSTLGTEMKFNDKVLSESRAEPEMEAPPPEE